mgnify:CR=1 FL=1
MFKNMPDKKRGFTLIEILVVIAIIGILTGFLIISLKSTIKTANKVRALQNFDQIALAIQMYYEKYGDWPNREGSSGRYSFPTNWSGEPDFVTGKSPTGELDPAGKFYSGWDASYYCDGCRYGFRLFDFDNDKKPDMGMIMLGKSSRPVVLVYKWALCLTQFQIGNSKCGDIYYSQ